MMQLSREFVFLIICVKCVSDSLPCPANCKGSESKTVPTCNINTRICSEGCLAGYYGDICDRKCDSNCERDICQRQDGFCKCLSGYTFSTNSCEYITGVKCVSNEQCLNNMCLSASRDNCLEGCKPGRFGKFCKRRCSSHCFCEQESGNCVSCEEGWFGEKCSSACNPGCFNKKCDRIGTCFDGCTTGLYGETCELKCSAPCVSGCDQLSGECVQCEAGWYGSTCQSECSAGCAGSYKDCDKEGTCIGGCVKGYYGDKCGSACPEGCYDDVCDLKGNCSTCKPGLYGSFCLQSCEKCSDGVCDVNTGKCTKGCQIGLYGERCTKTCRKCTDKFCDSATGECSIGCQSGYYGSVCDMACFDCKGACDRNTGECKGTWMPYIIGGGVLLSIGVLAVCIACCLKRINNVIYVDVKWRRRDHNAVQDASYVVSPGDVVPNEDITVTPPTVCSIGHNIRPRHSEGSENNLQIQVQFEHEENELQVTDSSSENLPPSDRRLHSVLQCSNERLETYVMPNYIELNEDLMNTLPQQTQGAEAPCPVLNTSQFYDVADVHRHPDGEISIPLIAECFRTTETEDIPSDKESQPENYDHLFKDYMQY